MRRAVFILLVLLVVPAAIAVKAAHAEHVRIHPVREPETIAVASPSLPGVRDVSFSTADGLRLAGWYAPGINGAAVVFAGGWSAKRNELLPEAKLLHDAGFGVLLFDWRGHGASDGTRSTWGDRERDDLRAALDFAAAQPDVTSHRLGLFGFSMGGAVAGLVAPDEPRVAAVAIAGAYPTLEDTTRKDFERWGALSGTPAVWTLRLEGIRVDEVRPVDRLCAIAPRPLLVIDGSEDETRVERQSERLLAAACEPKALHVVPGAHHGHLMDAGDADYPALLLAHFGRIVAVPPPSP